MTIRSRLTNEVSRSSASTLSDTVPRTLAVTGGKGGVGKTQVALNLALVLADQGKKTLLLDGDTELANVNVMLGLYPSVTLEHVVLGECSLRDALLPVSDGLDLLPGASGVPGILEQPDDRQADFLTSLRELESEYDVVLIDTAAGLRSPSLHMVAASHVACVVITPDPTSLTDAFSLLKVLHKKEYRRTPSVIVNMARGATEAQAVYRRFSGAVLRYIGLQTHYLGAIWRDETIAQSVTSQRPVASLPSSDPSCRQFWTLADMVTVRWSQGVAPANGFAGYWQRFMERHAGDRSEPRESVGSRISARPRPDWLAWAEDASLDIMERNRRLNVLFETLGSAPDEDLVDALAGGLQAVNWDGAAVPVREQAAERMRELASHIDPHKAGGNRQVRTPGISAFGYDNRRFGSQQALARQLQASGPERSLDELLQSPSPEDEPQD